MRGVILKRFSVKTTLYLLLTSQIFGLLLTLFVLIIYRDSALEFAENSVGYNIFNLICICFLYYNIAFINKEFKIASIIKILSSVLSSSSIFLSRSSLIINTSLSPYSMNEIIISLLGIIFIYYFYKGFSNFTLEFDTVLYGAWKRLGRICLVASIISFLIEILLLFNKFSIIITQEFLLSQIFLYKLPTFLIAVSIFEFIYTLKTIKALENIETQKNKRKKKPKQQKRRKR